ncbi:MAG: DUF2975 domain-containing protein [Erythrobacter sp.]
MSQNPRPDFLLKAANILLIITQAALALGALALVIGIPTFLIFQGDAAAELQAQTSDPNAVLPVIAIVGVMLIALTIIGMAFTFFGRMRQIAATVEGGDPFVPENADRLTLMAWLMLAMQVLAIPTAGIAIYIASKLGEDAGKLDASFDLSGIIMVLTLFILARVFRKGTELREDLEGTV